MIFIHDVLIKFLFIVKPRKLNVYDECKKYSLNLKFNRENESNISFEY